MWESFERRFAAEHSLASSVRGQRLLDQLAGTPAPLSDAALPAEIDRLSQADLRAFYIAAVERTGGPSGRDVTAETERWQPHRDRLRTLRAAASAALASRTALRTDQLAAQDLASVETCAPVDKRIEQASDG